MSIFRRSPVNPSTRTFPNINLTKTIKNLLGVSKIIENSCNNFYFHLYTIDMSYKSFSYLTSSSVKSVNPNFRQYQPDTKNGKFNCCLEIQPEMAAKISISTVNLVKSSSNPLLMSISRRGPVYLSTPTFSNIILTKTIKNLLFQKSLKKCCNNLYFHLIYIFYIIYLLYKLKVIFLCDITFPSWSGKSFNPNFPQ